MSRPWTVNIEYGYIRRIKEREEINLIESTWVSNAYLHEGSMVQEREHEGDMKGHHIEGGLPLAGGAGLVAGNTVCPASGRVGMDWGGGACGGPGGG